MDAEELITRLREEGDPGIRASLAHMGIPADHAVGIAVPRLRALARELGTDHDLALGLWASGIHEARILATMVADPDRVDADLMEAWAAELPSWDLADQAAGNLFWRAAPAWDKAAEWPDREEELVRRAGFALQAALALHDAEAPDAAFEPFLPRIEAAATEPGERVRKAVARALHQIGKRSAGLNERALKQARDLQDPAARPAEARKLGREAERELASEAVQARLGSI